MRGISKRYKQEQLVRDVSKYKIDICCLQETKIKEGCNEKIDGHQILTFSTNAKDYENGFLISKKGKNICTNILPRLGSLATRDSNNCSYQEY